MVKQYVAYYRVSTDKQGQSKLGLESQKKAVTEYIGSSNLLLAEFTEVETGKGKNAFAKRPQLELAIKCAKKHKATLLIAKLDRLSRNVAFIASLMEEKLNFICCDMPSATKTMLHMVAAFAELERDMISKRTKEALAAIKARGKKLGNPKLNETINKVRKNKANQYANNLYPTLLAWKAAGFTQRQMVAELNKLGIQTAAGLKSKWHLFQVQRILHRQHS